MAVKRSERPDQRPAFLFYPRDWRTDLGLRRCSLAARGLWIEMLCIMWDCNPRGMLKQNGSIITSKDIATMVGSFEEVTDKLLKELEETGVCSKHADGTIYNRRMLRDEELRGERARAGAIGGRSKGSSKTEAEQQANVEQASSSCSDFAKKTVGGDMIGGVHATENATEKEKGGTGGRSTNAEFVAAWNAAAERFGLARVVRLIPKRVRLLRERRQEGLTVEAYRAALEEIGQSQFLRGSKGWRAGFDWSLRPDSVTKLTEGVYRDAGGANGRVAAPAGKYNAVMEEAGNGKQA